jgi:adhesin transport system outer membrane protein
MMSRLGHRRRVALGGAFSVARAMLRAAAALLAAWVAPGPAAAQGVPDTVRATLGSNPELGAARTGRLAVDQELSQARAGYLPSLEARASVGPEYTKSTGDRRRFDRDDDTLLGRADASLRLSQRLFDGFETASEVARQRARVDSAANRCGRPPSSWRSMPSRPTWRCSATAT